MGVGTCRECINLPIPRSSVVGSYKTHRTTRRHWRQIMNMSTSTSSSSTCCMSMRNYGVISVSMARPGMSMTWPGMGMVNPSRAGCSGSAGKGGSRISACWSKAVGVGSPSRAGCSGSAGKGRCRISACWGKAVGVAGSGVSMARPCQCSCSVSMTWPGMGMRWTC